MCAPCWVLCYCGRTIHHKLLQDIIVYSLEIMLFTTADITADKRTDIVEWCMLLVSVL